MPTPRDARNVIRLGRMVARGGRSHHAEGADRADALLDRGERALDAAVHVGREMRSGRPQQRLLAMLGRALMNGGRR
jgi:hypothetical protein